ncbi:AAA family ATPase [Thioclava sp.]|uniref:AAA family ATPase n=1 Tax=Thioclava sp. TaxID=1933450 RepID=UPI003AA85F9B
MIVDFTISNFRSIKNEQVFSLFAESKSDHLSGNIFYPGNGKLGLFKTAAVYGSNASGKSNILKAFSAIKYLICDSGDLKDGDNIPCYEPYELCEENKHSPITFEIEFFSKDNLRYIYKVSYLENKITHESLDFYPSRQKANLFSRNENDDWDDITFGKMYKGGRKKIAFFNNSTYIAKAGNTADAPDVIKELFNYFRSGIIYMGFNYNISLSTWRDNTTAVNRISNVLSSIDTGIRNINFEDRDISSFQFSDDMPKELATKIKEDFKKVPVFFHEDENGNTKKFSEDMESSGTQRIFRVFPVIMEAFENGSVLVIDELESSFHPHIAELIINLFNDKKVNVNGAQLIFSTHNIGLMSPELLRRDQLWLTEKNKGETVLASLEDFDKGFVKIDSPFGKWYADGRFGAVPQIDYDAIREVLKESLVRVKDAEEKE